MLIRIGTRGSKLALWQARFIAEKLERGGLETKILIIETKGDKMLDVLISKIGSKGVFTEEIEEQLKTNKIDIAVHSAKDVPSILPDGFQLIAFTEREKASDVLVSRKQVSLHEKELVIGTSSTRRIALLKHYYPAIKTVDMRGNLETRLSKLGAGHCGALLLAYAGIHRMGYDEFIQKELSVSEFTPSVGQGSIAVEVYKDVNAGKKEQLNRLLNHKETETCLMAERAFLRILNGGCSIPAFALCKLVGNNKLNIGGGVVSLNGERMVRSEKDGHITNPEEVGFILANEVLSCGGDDILKEIRKGI